MEEMNWALQVKEKDVQQADIEISFQKHDFGKDKF